MTTSDPTIPELRARLRKLLANATPGPWRVDQDGYDTFVFGCGPVHDYSAPGGPLSYGEAADRAMADGELIAEAVNALPALLDALDHLESLTTWRPISEPPSAEVHAWCGGRYLFENDDGSGFVMTVNFDAGELEEFFGALTCARYLPIPPTDERRG